MRVQNNIAVMKVIEAGGVWVFLDKRPIKICSSFLLWL